jgi:tRNA pseudouridine38-40 synthase
MRRIALLLEYDGTDFAGSQSQRAQRTVQDVLEDALTRFTGERRRAAFAGRTDAGVHAAGQVAALGTETDHSAATFRDALNHFLPEDVVVRVAAEVAEGFDPRRDARSRCYRYRIEDGRARGPLTRRAAWQLPHRLDAAAMAEAAALLPRTPRDWSAFAGPVPEGYSTVRVLERCEVNLEAGEDGRRVMVTMEAGGFLPHQVRRTVGALERVGSGRMRAEEFAALVDGPPCSVGPAAPPQGLTLLAVRYPDGVVAWETEARDTRTDG